MFALGHEVNLGPGLQLQPDAAAQLAEELTLRMQAERLPLQLSDDQWSAFAAVTIHYQAVRQAYEATLAQATIIGPGRYRLDIPAYPGAGDALRARLFAELEACLGAPATESIARQFAGVLESHFGGFGLGIQTLEFVADERGVDAEYQVTRTVQFWNTAHDSDRFATRRETYFPGIEDPTGHTWGPFLALLNSGLGRHDG
jgi:hypothetical protein